MRIVAVGLALLLAVDAAAAAPTSNKFRDEDRVIFTAEAARKVWARLLRPPAGPPWTPTLAAVRALEQRLPDYIRHHLPPGYWEFHSKDRPLWERAPGYKRQYVGIRRNGRRAIYANFFCDAGPNWRAAPVDVDDGGDCYFQIEYDVDKATFSDLSINGDA